MSLKEKLARLRPPPGEGRSRLDELRERMQALTEAGPEATPEPRTEVRRTAPRFEELGLVPAENEFGPFWHRREVLTPSRRVGRSVLLDALGARADVLALLALDAKLAGIRLERALYLDTETTGLGAGASTFPFLIGLCHFDAGQAIFEQLFLAGPEQERAVLHEVEARLARAEVLVSFNGKSFDWPLLRTRFGYHRAPAPAELPHLDLLHIARRVHGVRIGRCTLKDVEGRVLGHQRVGDIEGALVAACYSHYLRSGEITQLAQVLEHNALDVWSMSALVGLYGQAVPDLDARDLAQVSRTYRRAKAYEQAHEIASHAVARGGGAHALRARAEVAKALGERLLALRDFESAEQETDDPDLRLELVKLYEHYQKDPARALELLARGTSESAEATARRSARLQKKLEKAGRARAAARKGGPR